VRALSWSTPPPSLAEDGKRRLGIAPPTDEVQATRHSSPFARPPGRTADVVAWLSATLGCVPQPPKQEPLGSRHHTCAAFAVVPLARRQRERGSGERDLGAMVLPLSPGRRFIRHGDDRSHPLYRTAQIRPTSGHCTTDYAAQWAVEVHRRRVCGPRSCARLAGCRMDSARAKMGQPKFGPAWDDLGRKQI
jgi:hypothetical protein